MGALGIAELGGAQVGEANHQRGDVTGAATAVALGADAALEDGGGLAFAARFRQRIDQRIGQSFVVGGDGARVAQCRCGLFGGIEPVHEHPGPAAEELGPFGGIPAQARATAQGVREFGPAGMAFVESIEGGVRVCVVAPVGDDLRVGFDGALGQLEFLFVNLRHPAQSVARLAGARGDLGDAMEGFDDVAPASHTGVKSAQLVQGFGVVGVEIAQSFQSVDSVARAVEFDRVERGQLAQERRSFGLGGGGAEAGIGAFLEGKPRGPPSDFPRGTVRRDAGAPRRRRGGCPKSGAADPRSRWRDPVGCGYRRLR